MPAVILIRLSEQAHRGAGIIRTVGLPPIDPAEVIT